MNIHALGRDPPCPCHTATPKRYLLSARVTTASSASFRDQKQRKQTKETQRQRGLTPLSFFPFSSEKSLIHNDLLLLLLASSGLLSTKHLGQGVKRASAAPGCREKPNRGPQKISKATRASYPMRSITYNITKFHTFHTFQKVGGPKTITLTITLSVLTPSPSEKPSLQGFQT